MTVSINAVSTLISTILDAFLPMVSNATQVGKIINTLVQIIPIATKEAHDLVQPIKNIISSLSSNPASTLDQLAALAALDAQCDADFENAAANAGFPPDTTQ